MKQSGNCGSCARGMKININRDIFCKIHGIVTRDYSCSHYVRGVDTWTDLEERAKCIQCQYFIETTEIPGSSASMGFCQLFTVRSYDGEKRSACSKFLKKSDEIIS